MKTILSIRPFFLFLATVLVAMSAGTSALEVMFNIANMHVCDAVTGKAISSPS